MATRTPSNRPVILAPRAARRWRAIGPWLPLLAALCVAAPAQSQTPPARPAAGVPAPAMPSMAPQSRQASLPARGLFVGDQLSASARDKLTEVLIDALSLDVEVALVVPVGPWVIDGGGHTERDLTERRLAAVRKFLTDRGVEPKRIFVESRTDAKVSEPRLDIQLIGRPAVN
jgi:OOP family OmpA-OmpF porin